MEEAEYNICEKEVLLSYNAVKDNLSANNSVIICQHLGTFTQEILVSFLSLIENSLLQNEAAKIIHKRLVYLTIESIQNIMRHADKLPNNNQLAYVVICKSGPVYSLYSSNTVVTENMEALVRKIEKLSDIKEEDLNELILEKIRLPKISNKGGGGIGFMTMIIKSKRDFDYKILKLSSKYSLFQLQLNLKYS